MFNTKNKRWRLFADLPIQGGLLIRIVGYWIITQLAYVGTLAMFDFLSNGQSQSTGIVEFLTPAIVVSLLMLPILMLEMTVFSNRFVGPVVNLRKKMIKLANGESVEKVHFRAGDCYADMAEAFNAIRRQMLENEFGGLDLGSTVDSESQKETAVTDQGALQNV